MSEGSDWFAHKRFGFGASWPISWQGWAVLLAYVVVMGLCALLLSRNWVACASIALIATATFIVITSRTTRGGWRWRWGEKD